MVGFPAKVDRHATMALLKKMIRRPRQKEGKDDGDVQTDLAKAGTNRTKQKCNVFQELDLDLDNNRKQRATLHSIMAGSIRPNARLAKSHNLMPKCRCGAEKEDVQHVFNNCPDQTQITENMTT